jgi:hypothetical protein
VAALSIAVTDVLQICDDLFSPNTKLTIKNNSLAKSETIGGSWKNWSPTSASHDQSGEKSVGIVLDLLGAVRRR